VYDCSTNALINLNNTALGDITVDLVGGNECVAYDEATDSFTQASGINTKSVRKETVYDTVSKK